MRPRALILLGFAAACARTEYVATGPRLPARPDGCDVTEAKDRAVPFVCKAGGTAIVLPATDGGTYNRATVIAEGAR